MDSRLRAALSALLLVFLDDLVVGVQITDLSVPQEIPNGTRKAILDCQYSLRPDEVEAESGLVVKWFFNNGPYPVYQWIPRQKPQDLGILRGKLNLTYEASNHDATKHRALYILNPTTELSGDYKCSVSTFQDEDFMIKPMIVYAPEKRLEVVQSKTGLETVNITCTAQGVYPEPKIALFKDPDRKDSKEDRKVLEGVVVETVSRAGVYDISASTIVHDHDLTTPTVFGCEVTIPSTSYANRKNIVYYPGQALPWTDSGAGVGERVCVLSLFACLAFSFSW